MPEMLPAGRFSMSQQAEFAACDVIGLGTVEGCRQFISFTSLS